MSALTNGPIEFRATRDEAECSMCGALFAPTSDGRFEVSSHLRQAHGFGPQEIDFEITGEVICPQMQYIAATQKISRRKEKKVAK